TLFRSHLTGPNDVEKVRSAYAAQKRKAIVHAFWPEMELALGAATVAVSRAGASSLAELAAMRVPAILIPYPAAADNHQFHNARAFVQAGAARMIEQSTATGADLSRQVVELTTDAATRDAMAIALAARHYPRAAEDIAERILSS